MDYNYREHSLQGLPCAECICSQLWLNSEGSQELLVLLNYICQYLKFFCDYFSLFWKHDQKMEFCLGCTDCTTSSTEGLHLVGPV